MTATVPTGAADAGQTPALALTAFLRGIERRGAVFAELHCGDPVLGEQGFAIALRVFRDHALAQPFARWPGLFWRALLASPQLRTGARAPHWPQPLAVLGGIGNGPRAALLLRLVAGLGDADAAETLGVATTTYRLALHQALPRRDDGAPDPEVWRALHQAVQELLRAMPAERIAHLARLRQAAVQGRRPELIGPLQPPPPAESDARPWPRLRVLLWSGFAACLLALGATFVWPFGFSGAPGDGQVRTRPLPPADAPASRYDAATRLLTERDFELLAAGDAVPPRDDPAFYAWYAAQRDAGAERDPDAGMRESMAPDLAESLRPETVDAP